MRENRKPRFTRKLLLLHLHPFNGLFFQDKLDKPAPEKQTILDFTGARDDGVAVASAGPYANHLAGCPSCHPTNSVKALKEGITFQAHLENDC